jgi:chromosome segregation ATPase
MSWGNVFHPEEAEDSFWPSFTDIMMVIVMTFLLVTVAVVLTNTRLLDELKSSVVAEQEASQLAEFTLQENATLEEQLDYFQQRSSALEMELLRSRAQTENTRSELLNTQAELRRVQSLGQQQAEQLAGLEQNLLSRNTVVKRLETELQQARQGLTAERDQLRLELSQLSAQSEQLKAELAAATQSLSTETSRLQSQLTALQSQLESSRADASASESALAALREQTEEDRLKLASLEGEYAELDKKYQKLLKPTRSSRGKTVVDVMYSKSGYRIRQPGEDNYRNVGLATINSELSALKAKHGTDLYVKIIIPEDSGLSYNQAWVFTRDMLNKYDYYYQEDNVAADSAAE